MGSPGTPGSVWRTETSSFGVVVGRSPPGPASGVHSQVLVRPGGLVTFSGPVCLLGRSVCPPLGGCRNRNFWDDSGSPDLPPELPPLC